MSLPLTENDIVNIALGTGFLGSGGGGDTKMAEIMLKQAIRNHSKIDITPIHTLPDTALAAAVGVMGAPTVLAEKLPSKEEGIIAMQKLETLLQKKIDYAIPMEIGGLNGLYAMYIAVQTQKTIIDGDCMGRAFPEIQMVTPNVYGKFNTCVAVIANAQQSCVLSANNLAELEAQARQQTIAMGGIVTLAYLPMTGKQIREYCVPHSISVAKSIGKHLQEHSDQDLKQKLNKSLIDTEYGPVEMVITGKITELERNFTQGFNKGWAIIEDDKGQQIIKVDFQNENLRITDLNTAKIIATVPTIITLIDNEARPLSCECLRAGLEVSAMTLQVPTLLRTPKAIAVFGPQVFNMHEQAVTA